MTLFTYAASVIIEGQDTLEIIWVTQTILAEKEIITIFYRQEKSQVVGP